VEPSKVEALPHRRHQKALEPLDRAPDRLRLSARVEAIGRVIPQCNSVALVAVPLTQHDWHGEWNYTITSGAA